MARSKKATYEQLQGLLAKLIDSLSERLAEGNASAAVIDQARRLLKDHGVALPKVRNPAGSAAASSLGGGLNLPFSSPEQQQPDEDNDDGPDDDADDRFPPTSH